MNGKMSDLTGTEFRGHPYPLWLRVFVWVGLSLLGWTLVLTPLWLWLALR